MSTRMDMLLASLLGLGLVGFFAIRAWGERSATIAIVGIGSVVAWMTVGGVGTYLIGQHSKVLAGLYIAVITVAWVVLAWNMQAVITRLWRWWMARNGPS